MGRGSFQKVGLEDTPDLGAARSGLRVGIHIPRLGGVRGLNRGYLEKFCGRSQARWMLCQRSNLQSMGV